TAVRIRIEFFDPEIQRIRIRIQKLDPDPPHFEVYSYVPDSPSMLKLCLVINKGGYGLRGDTEASLEEGARDQMETNFWGPVQTT
ncbi:uncharacterized oxidoreductase C162.03, partial [Aspergillus udagawae]